MPDHDVGTFPFSGRLQQGVQIIDVVLYRGGLVYRVAAARQEVRWTVARREEGSGTVVGAYPVGLGDRGQHRLLGWVLRCAPRFGAVLGPRDEHYGGTSFAPALHVYLAAADIHQAFEVLVVAGVTLTRIAFGGVVVAPATSERRDGGSQHQGHDRCQQHHFSRHTISSLSSLRACGWTVALVPERPSSPADPL